MITGRRLFAAGRVCVGVDGSWVAMQAVRVAVAAAAWRGTGLDVVHVAAPRLFGRFPNRDLLADAVATARAHGPGLDVRAVPRTGPVAPVLADLTRQVELLVLGSHGHSALTEATMGSVTLDVVTHAAGPVVVVRLGAAQIGGGPTIVAAVAVVGDEAVLDAAFAEAALRHAPLRIVSGAAQLAEFRRLLPAGLNALAPLGDDRTPENLQRWLDRYPHLEVTLDHSPDVPARAVLGAAHDAAVIVTGSRGRDRRTGWLLGSVSQTILRHASCPVMVVPTRSARP